MATFKLNCCGCSRDSCDICISNQLTLVLLIDNGVFIRSPCAGSPMVQRVDFAKTALQMALPFLCQTFLWVVSFNRNIKTKIRYKIDRPQVKHRISLRQRMRSVVSGNPVTRRRRMVLQEKKDSFLTLINMSVVLDLSWTQNEYPERPLNEFIIRIAPFWRINRSTHVEHYVTEAARGNERSLDT